jgi:hypothetical protein
LIKIKPVFNQIKSCSLWKFILKQNWHCCCQARPSSLPSSVSPCLLVRPICTALLLCLPCHPHATVPAAPGFLLHQAPPSLCAAPVPDPSPLSSTCCDYAGPPFAPPWRVSRFSTKGTKALFSSLRSRATSTAPRAPPFLGRPPRAVPDDQSFAPPFPPDSIETSPPFAPLGEPLARASFLRFGPHLTFPSLPSYSRKSPRLPPFTTGPPQTFYIAAPARNCCSRRPAT